MPDPTVIVQVAQTKAGYHSRLRALNQEKTWWTENYPEKRTAYEAIGLLPGVEVEDAEDGSKVAVFEERGYQHRVEIEEVDERTPEASEEEEKADG